MTGLNAPAREELGLSNVGSAPSNHSSFLNISHSDASSSNSLPKPLALSPRSFGMDDLRDFCGPLGSFKTGLTPRVFSTGLTPRSGLTPRLHTGFTPRLMGGSGGGADTNAFFSRTASGFSPRVSEANSKISPSGFTPRDVSGMKVPMRFPETFTNSPPKPQPNSMVDLHMQKQPLAPNGTMPPGMQQQMNSMGHMGMMDYMNRPGLAPGGPSPSGRSPASDKPNQDELDERRRMKNRERVRKCRKRKQDRLNFLEDRTQELEKENQSLRAKMARKVHGQEVALTEAQLNELRKKQNTTLASYLRAYNESGNNNTSNFEAAAKSIWTDNASIVYGSKNLRLDSLESILLNHQQALAQVFVSYKIKQYAVEWKPNCNDKCVVKWQVEIVLKAGAPHEVLLGAPFAELARELSDEVLTYHFVSHITFDDAKIVEEIRHLNLFHIGEIVLQKFAHEPQKQMHLIKCLLDC